MLGVLPVPHSGQVAVGARFARVLRRRLAIHLEDGAARLADHSAQKVDVVDLAGGGGRLVRLVDALQAGGDERFCFTDHAGGGADVVGRDTADLRSPLRGIVLNRL